ncbi:uncharacterized protein LOC105694751 [Orussus abietinus]|uniref:uncharacterized protein LOC105694751 n=1 Tax=Orussus abietinus TaxID=222816 RepID=UPI000625F519|nr:uncharacterized protein LOC105694751 [Orussus abietinus]XP_012271120.1 uncharacterized protein LOC105694751 [Orussus abietinus]
MNHIVVIRNYRPGDDKNCKEMIRDTVMSYMNRTFISNAFREITFQLTIMFAAIAFIFFGVPFTTCLFALPITVALIYVATYMGFVLKTTELDNEVSNISRIYMSNMFSNYWVAEVFETYLVTHHWKDVYHVVMTEQQFRESNIDISSRVKKIVGTIALTKCYRSDGGAFIKRLYVHNQYRRLGIGSCLMDVAMQFAINQGYRCIDLIASEYIMESRELCLKKGFQLKQMYHKPILGSFVTILMFELTYRIKPNISEDPHCSAIKMILTK